MTTYYVDTAGSDANNGTAVATPWATITKVNATTFAPGDTILFQRGKTWTAAALVADNAGTSTARVAYGSYGTGPAPIFSGSTSWPIAVTANFVTVQDVQAQNAGGDKVGIGVTGTDCLLQRVTATGNAIGVQAYNGAHRLRVTASNLSNNTTEIDPDGRGSAQGSTDDYGCNGVVILQADNCEIDHNTISGNIGVSPDFGYDGSAVEIFGSIGSVVHHNVCDNNQTFTELGDSRTSGTEFYDNLITANLPQTTPIGLNAQGTGTFGPVLATKFYNNTIVYTGTSQGIVVGAGCTAEVHNNIVVASYLGYSGGQKIDEGHNVYFGGSQGSDIWSTANASTNAIAPTSTIANPLFVSSTDYHLQASSPAVNRGVARPYATDLDGNPRTVGTAIDAGAYEVQATVTAVLVGAGALTAAVTVSIPLASSLTDDFTTQDTGKWTFYGAAAVTSGQVVLPCTSAYGNSIATVGRYSLVGSAVSAQVVATPALGNGTTEMYLQLVDSIGANNTLILDIAGTNLVARYQVAGTTTTGATIAYNAASHKFLRFREAGGTTFWETSPTTATWTTVFSVATPFALTASYVALGTGYYGTETAPGNAVFDNVNLIGPTGSASMTGAGALAVGSTARRFVTGVLAGGGALTATGTVTKGHGKPRWARLTVGGTPRVVDLVRRPQ